MSLTAAKPDAREMWGRIAASAAVLTFIVGDRDVAIAVAVVLGPLAGMGFLLARLLWRRPIDAPAPRPLPRRWGRGVFRRTGADQSFNTRLGWTSGSEPGGTLPDARNVTPYGLTGGGLYTDGFVALLVGIVLFGIAFLSHPLSTTVWVLYFGVLAAACYGAVVLVRWLRHR